MGLGERIIQAIERRRDRKQKAASGPHGDFFRSGGNELLYDVPVSTGDLVIDAGGYEGEWSARMIAKYGCQVEIFEPVPHFAEFCRKFFEKNSMVRVHAVALGGAARVAQFNLAANGTSEFTSLEDVNVFEAAVVDVLTVLDGLNGNTVGCLKLNIEGGEYEVLERLIEENRMGDFRCLLVQFHHAPADWERRREAILVKLQRTHRLEWGFPMVWEKWVIR